jgi:hypothetical protein
MMPTCPELGQFTLSLGASKGGQASVQKQSALQRRRIAKKAAAASWKNKSQ